MPKKIVALIKSKGHHFYCVNKIHRALGIDLVIIEDKYRGKVSGFRGLQAKLAMGSKAPKNPVAPIRIKTKQAVQINNSVFGEDWYDLDAGLEIFYCKSINDPEVENILKDRGVDILIDHGTSIVKNHVIATAEIAINLHWGLSPYYRGTHCTEWALINWDPRNIGVTIHRLAKEIDGGDVVGQGRVDIHENDSVDSINMKLTAKGTEILIDVLTFLHEGGELNYTPQDYSLGYLTLNRQWSRSLRKHVKDIERKGLLSKIIKSPARKGKLPIVKFK